MKRVTHGVVPKKYGILATQSRKEAIDIRK